MIVLELIQLIRLEDLYKVEKKRKEKGNISLYQKENKYRQEVFGFKNRWKRICSKKLNSGSIY